MPLTKLFLDILLPRGIGGSQGGAAFGIHSQNSFENEQQTAELKLLKECDRFSVANSTRLDLYPEILPLGTPLARQLSAEPTFLVPYRHR